MEYTVEIRATIRQKEGFGGGLEVHESATVDASGFMELCQVLGRFHEVIELLKSEKKKK